MGGVGIAQSATGWTVMVRFPEGARDCSLLRNVQASAGPTQPHIQWVPEAVSLERKAAGA
jgi:hypothetical protein